MTLAIYFAQRFFVSFIRVFLAIGLLVLLFDFITNLNRLNGLESPVKNAFSLSFLRTTTYLSLAMPLIMMLSSLAFSVGLARNNEFIVSRASGLSALKSLLSVMFSAFMVGIVSIFFFFVSPRNVGPEALSLWDNPRPNLDVFCHEITRHELRKPLKIHTDLST